MESMQHRSTMSVSSLLTNRDETVIDDNNNNTRLRHGAFGPQLLQSHSQQQQQSQNTSSSISSSNNNATTPSYPFSSSSRPSSTMRQQHSNNTSARNHLYVKLSPSGIGLMLWSTLTLLLIITLLSSSSIVNAEKRSRSYSSNNRLPENYNNSNNGFFVQIPYSSPPTVRPPPYTITTQKCPAMNVRENWLDTLCGDLNSGYVPKNPLGHKFNDGGSYPFEMIKNKTLEFFRRALPILKKDKSLPKVARYANNDFQPPTPKPQGHYRIKRDAAEASARSSPDLSSLLDQYLFDTPPRNNRRRRQGPVGNRFCENALHYHNRLCKLYNAMWGKAPHAYQNPRDSMENRFYHANPNNKNQYAYHHARPGNQELNVASASESSKSGKKISSVDRNPVTGDMPPTACASSAEYLTPVFARNHEGAWRYVVQIPKEGYFTQTVEVTKCLHTECNYMDGSCRTSPRWQSLLVAEMFYPDTAFPTTPKANNPSDPTSIVDFSKYQEFLNKRASRENLSNKSNEISASVENSTSSHCDGMDDIGCYQIRLFYDWFLIPGSCKCWKRQFDFTRPHSSH